MPVATIGPASPVLCSPEVAYRTGQVIGATNKYAEEPVDRPVHFQEVFATIYRNLGIDVEKATIDDLNGRPRFLVDGYLPMPELI